MMLFMRSTVRIDDDLMMELKERARRENVSQTRMLNRLLREGIQASRGRRAKKGRYKETTIAMGTPRVELDKALALAADFDDEEILRKMALRK
jgi:metal-responsive CopG/Arc/MetJ family transcriptional regulator